MSKKEWYENTIWNESIERQFMERLSKSRDNHVRAQALRIQAYNLWNINREKSLEFFQKVLNEYGEESWINYSFALDDLARNYLKEGNYAESEKYFRLLYYHPKVQSNKFKSGQSQGADIMLLKITLINNKRENYEEMFLLLKDHDIDLDFLKSLKYEFVYHAAWLCSEMGKMKESKEYAQIAMDLINDPRPSAPRHPGVGDIHPTVEERQRLYEILNR